MGPEPASVVCNRTPMTNADGMFGLSGLTSFAEAEPLAMAEKAETWRRGTASQSQRDWRCVTSGLRWPIS